MNNSIGGQEVRLRDGNSYICIHEEDLPITHFNSQGLKKFGVDYISSFQGGAVLSIIKDVVQQKIVKRIALKSHQTVQGSLISIKRNIDRSKDGIRRELI